MSSLQSLKSKLALLEGSSASPEPINTGIDTRTAYRKKPDGFQYDDSDYAYDTETYGRIPPPAEPHQYPASYTSLLTDEEALTRELRVLEAELPANEKRLSIDSEWEKLHETIDYKNRRLQAICAACNTSFRVPPECVIAEPDTDLIGLLAEAPKAWQCEEESAERYKEKLHCLTTFALLNKVRYDVAVCNQKERSVYSMRDLARKLEHDISEGTSVLDFISSTMNQIDLVLCQRETSLEAEKSIVALNRLCEREGRSTTLSKLLEHPPPTREEVRAKNLGLPRIGEELPFDDDIRSLIAMRDDAQDSLKPHSDMGACQRRWMYIREAATNCLSAIRKNDAERQMRQMDAEARYGQLREHQAQTWISDLTKQ